MPEPTDLQTIQDAVVALREEVEKKSINPEKVDAINEFLDKQEELNQKQLKDTARRDNAETELKEQIVTLQDELKRIDNYVDRDTFDELKTRADDLEKALAKTPKQAADPSKPEQLKQLILDDPECKAFTIYARKGETAVVQEEKQLLRTDNDTDGGFLVPVMMDNELRRQIEEISNVRSVSRVRVMAGKTLNIPVRIAIPQAEYEGEAEEGPEDISTYRSEQVIPFRQTVTVPITQDMLMDSAFNMQAEITGDVATSFAQGEGRANVIGSGFKQPSGFLADTRVTDTFIDSAASGVLDADVLLTVTGQLKTGYNPVYAFNRRTLANIRTQKGSDGQYLWLPSLNGGVQNQLAGFPYAVFEDMPDIAGSAFAVAFGDFMRGYEIFDRTGTTLIRDNVTQKRSAIVEWCFYRYNTGQVIIPEAITGIKILA